LGALFTLFELFTNGAITRWAMNSISLLQPHNLKHVHVVKGEVTTLNLADLNRNVAILGFNLWPALLLLKNFGGRARRALVTGFFCIVTIVPMAISQH
jgi:hypothetical protein